MGLRAPLSPLLCAAGWGCGELAWGPHGAFALPVNECCLTTVCADPPPPLPLRACCPPAADKLEAANAERPGFFAAVKKVL